MAQNTDRIEDRHVLLARGVSGCITLHAAGDWTFPGTDITTRTGWYPTDLVLRVLSRQGYHELRLSPELARQLADELAAIVAEIEAKAPASQ